MRCLRCGKDMQAKYVESYAYTENLCLTCSDWFFLVKRYDNGMIRFIVDNYGFMTVPEGHLLAGEKR